MSYPPAQPAASKEVQARYSQLLTRTGALFYQIKDLKARVPELESQLRDCEALKVQLEAEFKAALVREEQETANAVAPEST